MLDIGWTELLVIGIVALIVVGPKDLPGLFRSVGQFTARARAMAREFSRTMEDAARESGLDEARRDLRDMTSDKALGLDKLSDTARTARQGLDSVRKAARGDVKGLAKDLARGSTVTDPGDAPSGKAARKPAETPARTATETPAEAPAARPARKPAARKAAAKEGGARDAAGSAPAPRAPRKPRTRKAAPLPSPDGEGA